MEHAQGQQFARICCAFKGCERSFATCGDLRAHGEEEVVEKSREEKAEEIADLIRGAVETDLWATNGGEYGSIKYFNGSLIIKAPLYVHNQIGMPAYTIGRRSNDGVILRAGNKR